ncbi:MAG: hypothetical protein NC212_08495 [Staphylococcus sp.]|nr:hypothetical protein [Staphylococcus sp.]
MSEKVIEFNQLPTASSMGANEYVMVVDDSGTGRKVSKANLAQALGVMIDRRNNDPRWLIYPGRLGTVYVRDLDDSSKYAIIMGIGIPVSEGAGVRFSVIASNGITVKSVNDYGTILLEGTTNFQTIAVLHPIDGGGKALLLNYLRRGAERRVAA